MGWADGFASLVDGLVSGYKLGSDIRHRALQDEELETKRAHNRIANDAYASLGYALPDPNAEPKTEQAAQQPAQPTVKTEQQSVPDALIFNDAFKQTAAIRDPAQEADRVRRIVTGTDMVPPKEMAASVMLLGGGDPRKPMSADVHMRALKAAQDGLMREGRGGEILQFTKNFMDNLHSNTLTGMRTAITAMAAGDVAGAARLLEQTYQFVPDGGHAVATADGNTIRIKRTTEKGEPMDELVLDRQRLEEMYFNMVDPKAWQDIVTRREDATFRREEAGRDNARADRALNLQEQEARFRREDATQDNARADRALDLQEQQLTQPKELTRAQQESVLNNMVKELTNAAADGTISPDILDDAKKIAAAFFRDENMASIDAIDIAKGLASGRYNMGSDGSVLDAKNKGVVYDPTKTGKALADSIVAGRGGQAAEPSDLPPPSGPPAPTLKVSPDEIARRQSDIRGWMGGGQTPAPTQAPAGTGEQPREPYLPRWNRYYQPPLPAPLKEPPVAALPPQAPMPKLSALPPLPRNETAEPVRGRPGWFIMRDPTTGNSRLVQQGGR